jgi:GMP synthase-like glutamine amidotransferase
MSVTPVPTGRIPQARRARAATPVHTAAAVVPVIGCGGAHQSGCLVAILAERGLRVLEVDLDAGQALPAPDAHPVAILLGGDDLAAGVPPRLIDWSAAADRAGATILATGVGAHALARALGGDSAPRGRAQRGWISVASADPGLIPTGPWFAWADRPLVPPPGAEVLATSRSGVEAFGLRGHVGIHFHPQADAGLVEHWLDRAEAVPDHQGLAEATVRDLSASARAAAGLFSSLLGTTTPAALAA